MGASSPPPLVASALGARPGVPGHAGQQTNLGASGPQHPVAQISPSGQSPCFEQPSTPPTSQMATAVTQTPPPPGFFAQKQPGLTPAHPVPEPLSPQVNGSPLTHFAVQVRWTHFCPSAQWRLRRQVWALASRPPNLSREASVPAATPPSSRRRGTLINAFVIASKRLASIANLRAYDADSRRGFLRCPQPSTTCPDVKGAIWMTD